MANGVAGIVRSENDVAYLPMGFPGDTYLIDLSVVKIHPSPDRTLEHEDEGPFVFDRCQVKRAGDSGWHRIDTSDRVCFGIRCVHADSILCLRLCDALL